MKSVRNVLIAYCCGQTLYHLIDAHSWVDCIDHDFDIVYTRSAAWVLTGSGGNGVCEGYGYNYPGRGDPDVNVKFTYKLLPDEIRASSKPLCQSTQDQAGYTDWRTRIHAKPGDTLYYAYFANGHTAIDKRGSGTAYGVYWTHESDTMLLSPHDLTPDKLVDGTLHDFDDGNCGEAFDRVGNPTGRAGSYFPCVGSFVVPRNVASGTYSMVWYWTFFNQTDFDGNFTDFQGAGGAAYSTCFDMVIEGDENKVKSSSNQTQSVNKNGSTQLVDEGGPAQKVNEDGLTQILVEGGLTKVVNEGDPTQNVDDGGLTQNVNEDVSPHVGDEGSSMSTTSVFDVLNEVSNSSSFSHQNEVKNLIKTKGNHSNPHPLSPYPIVSPVMDKVSNKSNSSSKSPDKVNSSTSTSHIWPSPIHSMTFSSLGGSGYYSKVIDMSCDGSQQCVQGDFGASGPLAPFHEDLTLSFRGPMSIQAISVFQPSRSGFWQQISSFNASSGNVNNMVFLNNRGDAAKSGEWDICHGNSQSFATFDGQTSSTESTLFKGKLEDGVEMNVMSTIPCGSDCGFSRGIAYAGWSGIEKIFMVKAKMPQAQNGRNIPAIWMLNGQVVRTAQYGCNCRGQGTSGKWKGGCGELDVAEVVAGDTSKISSAIYSFQGARSADDHFVRPTVSYVIYVVIFALESSQLGQIQILTFEENEVDLSIPPTSQLVDKWLQERAGPRVSF
uniref:glucan endo-1,3-beta-D-glucosidase n=1 Tax=Albugo laibachii Nc14 TaxID=890382 RepID=F0VYW5_9STRA|nr:protein TOS1 putative [Albugo laibachii Nc14]|eukprot:CCA13980.1 protein TOS1 putative [Albugo laibachii Nc14]